MNFAEVEREVAKLRQDLAAGRLTEEACKARMRELMVEDADGNWWMVGYETGEWYRHDGTDWVPDQPPGRAALRAAPQPAARSVAPAKPKLRRRVKPLTVFLAVVGIVVLLLSLVADPIGISGQPGFDLLQIVGTIVGAVVTVVGLVLTLKK